MSGEQTKPGVTYEEALARLTALSRSAQDRADQCRREANATMSASEGTALDAAEDLDRAAEAFQSDVAAFAAIRAELDRRGEEIERQALELSGLRFCVERVLSEPGCRATFEDKTVESVLKLKDERDEARAERDRAQEELRLEKQIGLDIADTLGREAARVEAAERALAAANAKIEDAAKLLRLSDGVYRSYRRLLEDNLADHNNYPEGSEARAVVNGRHDLLCELLTQIAGPLASLSSPSPGPEPAQPVRIICDQHHTMAGGAYYKDECPSCLSSPGPERETISCAAVQEQATARSHAECLHKLAAREPRRSVQGFITSSGRFVDRWEALKIATEAGQLEGRTKHRPLDQLMSEDLWSREGA